MQLVLLGDVAEPGYLLHVPPLDVSGGELTVLVPAEPIELAAAHVLHLFVARGTVSVAGQELKAGDSVRVRDAPVIVEGDGEVLVWRSTAPATR